MGQLAIQLVQGAAALAKKMSPNHQLNIAHLVGGSGRSYFMSLIMNYQKYAPSNEQEQVEAQIFFSFNRSYHDIPSYPHTHTHLPAHTASQPFETNALLRSGTPIIIWG